MKEQIQKLIEEYTILSNENADLAFDFEYEPDSIENRAISDTFDKVIEDLKKLLND